MVTTRNRIVVEARTDIFNYPYIQGLDVWLLEEKEGRKKRRKKIVSLYDNHLMTD